tara:strand:+ start:1444 stop:1662 length:219 start_codon:yes stop_codon:yes gene_type:complete
MGMNKEFIDWAFKALAVGLATYFLTQFTEMKNSVLSLNTKMAVLITEAKYQKDQIKENKLEIREIKDRLHGR